MSTSRTSAIRAVATATTLAAAGIMTFDAAPRAFAAQTLVVDTLSDNPADGFTLREAVDEANNDAQFTTIEFAEGLAGTITLNSGLVLEDDVEIFGPGADVLTIDADGTGTVIDATQPSATLAIQDLTITGGAVVGSGGALTFNGDDLTVRRVTFDDNQASNQGGAVWITNPDSGLIEIMDSTFTNNRSGNAGGGLYFADLAGTGTLRMVGNDFVDNETVNGNGGGAFINAPARDVIVMSNTATGNDASNASAGGMWIDGGTATVMYSTFEDNTAATTFGGATINANAGDTVLDGVTLRGNMAATTGGANVSASGDVTLTDVIVDANEGTGAGGVEINTLNNVEVVRSTFTGNESLDTGALQIASATSALILESTFAGNTGGLHGALGVIATPTTISRSTFEGNIADPIGGQGGAVYMSGATDLSVDNSTFHRNTANEGGAIHGLGGTDVHLFHVTMTENEATSEAGGVYVFAGADATMTNSIVSDNIAPTFPDVNDPTLDIGNSILGDGSGLVLNGAGFLVGIDPMLRPIADNGGPTRTLMPSIDSDAIDGAAANVIPLDYVDQRGRTRGHTADMGSVEVGTGDDQIWVPTAPARFVDTRANGETIDGQNEATGAFDALEQRQVTFAGRGDIPADAVGVIANVTAVNPGGNGFITAHPCVNPAPLVASLNYTPGVNLGNEIVLGLDAGDACFFTPVMTDLTVDVVGYIPASSPYTAIDPTRYADTRATGVTFDGAYQGEGAPGAGQDYAVKITDRGSVPTDAEAVVMYVAAVKPDANGFVTVWDCDGGAPLASSLNHVQGVNRGNEIIAEVGTGDMADMVCFYTSANVELTVDVVGYIPAGSNFDAAESPSRLLDTRPGESTIDGVSAGDGIVDAGETIELTVAGRAGVPELATTATINVTAVNPSANGFVTVYDCVGDAPLASSLNYVPGVNGGNEIVASLDDNGKVCLYTSAATHLTADVTGWTSL